MLEEFSQDLCAIIAQCPQLEAKLAKLHALGYSLNLLLDCRKEAAERVPAPERTLLPQRTLSSQTGSLDEIASGTPTGDPPVRFKINAQDLAFLRSVGIDPTRPARTRRTSP